MKPQKSLLHIIYQHRKEIMTIIDALVTYQFGWINFGFRVGGNPSATRLKWTPGLNLRKKRINIERLLA